MAKSVVWTQKAFLDLQDIFEYNISSFNQGARIKIISESAETLKDFPKIGKRLPEFPELEYYELIVGNYRLIFRPSADGDSVIILAVKHCRALY